MASAGTWHLAGVWSPAGAGRARGNGVNLQSRVATWPRRAGMAWHAWHEAQGWLALCQCDVRCQCLPADRACLPIARRDGCADLLSAWRRSASALPSERPSRGRRQDVGREMRLIRCGLSSRLSWIGSLAWNTRLGLQRCVGVCAPWWCLLQARSCVQTKVGPDHSYLQDMRPPSQISATLN